jgi:hypothetical protein
MTETDLRALVDWTVEDSPPGRSVARALGALVHLASTVVSLGADAGTGARRPTWDVPADPGGYVDLGAVQLRLPTTARAELVQATRRNVWTTSPGRPPSRLPVESWRVAGAVPRSRPARRHANAPWTLTVTDGVRTGSLTGAWLALAWIGHLAGWPEPAPAEAGG